MLALPETIDTLSTKLVSPDTQKQHLRLALEKEILKKSPFMLGKYVLGMERYCEPHKIWDKFVRASLDLTCKTSNKALVLQPRETFKSTFFTVNVVINLLINNPNVSILIVSATGATSTALLRQIKAHLESNEKLIKLFGTFITDNWNQNAITIKQRTSLNVKEPSVMSVGKGNFVTGLHPDVIIWDDVVGPNDRVSKAERLATLYYFQDCADLLKKDVGQMLCVGTRYHQEDCYAHILKINATLPEAIKFKTLITPAINKETKELNFPTILTQEKLEELRLTKVGKDALDYSSFSAQYLLEPLSSSDTVFHQFHYYDHETTEYSIFVTFVDPALSVSKGACYSAIITLGKLANGEHKGKWGVAYASIVRRNPTQIMKDVIRIHKFFAENFTHIERETRIAKQPGAFIQDPNKVEVIEKKLPIPHDCFIEDNGFQSLLANNTIKAALEEGYYLPIVGRTTTTNKQMKITSIEPVVSQGMIVFRKDYQTAPEGYSLLLEQLHNFPQDEVDGPDALAMCWEQAKSWRNNN